MATTKRIRKIAVRPAAGVNGLILGYAPDQQSGNLGFRGRSGAVRTGEPLAYQGDGHLVTVAPTGRGKGVSVIIPTLLTYRGPAIVFDPKGENYLVTARRRRELGQQVVRLDPFGVIQGDSDCLNPLDIFQLPNSDLETDAQMLAEHLSTSASSTKEPFWDLSGRALIGSVIAHVAENLPAKEKHLGSVRNALTADDTVYHLATVLDTVGKKMNRYSYSEIAAFLQMPEITRGGVLATANSYIKAYASARVLQTLSGSSLKLSEVISGNPLTIYLIIPPDKLNSHKSLYKLWVAALLKAVTSREQIPEFRTLFLLDECAQMGHFPYLETLITLCRGFGVQCHTFWQDLSQIKMNYPSSWETILNNAAVLQVFGVGNHLMAQQWAGILNTRPAELLNLTRNQQMLFIEGQGSQRCRKLDYRSDQPYRGLFDPNPFYQRANHPPEDRSPGSRR